MKRLVNSLILITLALLVASGDNSSAFAASQPKPAPFTANDFAYIPEFSISPQKNFKKAFICPEYEDVIRGFGNPVSETWSDIEITMEYAFGTVNIDLQDGTAEALWLIITNDRLPGPRNIYVGDSYEKVLAGFKNNRKAFPKNQFKVTLYAQGKNPRQAGYIFFDTGTGQPTDIYYWQGNRSPIACSVDFVIEDGVVNGIIWRIDERA